jgi:hypothetical protein
MRHKGEFLPPRQRETFPEAAHNILEGLSDPYKPLQFFGDFGLSPTMIFLSFFNFPDNSKDGMQGPI